MQNKRRFVVFAIFVLCMFFLMTFANGSDNSKIATRNVEFIDGFDNSTISSQKVEVGTDVEVPESPVHKNYVFVGWFLYDDHDVKITKFKNIMEDLKVIALYADDINNNGIADENDDYYTVKFIDSLNNNVISRQTVLVGMDAKAPKKPFHEGYIFTGWNKGYTNIQYDITIKALYRKTPVTTYIVTFIDGDTNAEIAAQKIEEGASATLPEVPKHENRVFDHWDGNYTDITSDETIIAIYVDDKNNDGIADEDQEHYTVTYVDYNDEVIKIIEDVLVNMPTPTIEEPTREYYRFTRWDPEVNETVTKDITYKATYVPNNDENKDGIADEEQAHYTVTYVDYNDEIIDVIEDVLVDMPTPTVEEPTREYYRFTGWDPKVNETVTGDITYKATYEANNDENKDGIADEEQETYEVIYKLDENTEYARYEVLEKLPTPIVEEPTRRDYLFIGWNPKVAETVIGDAVYVAEWKDDKNNDGIADEEQAHYTVTYVDYNDEIIDVIEDVLVDMPTPIVEEPTRENYRFMGWDPEVSETVTGDVTYKATYEPNNDENKDGIADEEQAHYTVTYVDYNDEIIDVIEDVLVDMPTPTVEEPTREYYRFTGWDPEVNETVTGDVTYKATYEPNNDENKDGIADEEQETYEVIYKLDENTEYARYEVLEKLSTPIVEKPTRRDYLFISWTPEVSETVTGDAVYVAEWKDDKNNDGIADEEQETYEVIYKLDENTEYARYEVLEKLPTPIVEKPTRRDYLFISWTPEVSETVTGDAVYVAEWKDDKNNDGIADEEQAHYTVIYVDYNDEVIETIENILVDMPTPTVEEPTREYYRFTGWTPEVNETVTGDITYKATYKPNNDENKDGVADEEQETYEVIYKLDENTEYARYEVLEKLPTPIVEKPTRRDYLFISWTPEVSETVTGDAVYVAEWKDDKNNDGIADEDQVLWQVMFFGFDGSQIGEDQYVVDGESAIAPNAPSVAGYDFNGWDKDFTSVKSDLDVNAIYVDSEAPKITPLVQGYNENKNANIQATVTDNVGVVEVRYAKGNLTSSDYNSAQVITKGENGYEVNGIKENGVYTYFAIDAAGNIAVLPIEITCIESDLGGGTLQGIAADTTWGRQNGFIIGYSRQLNVSTNPGYKIVDARYHMEWNSYKNVTDFQNQSFGTSLMEYVSADGKTLDVELESAIVQRVSVYVKYEHKVEVAPGIFETRYVENVYAIRFAQLLPQ